MAIHYPQEYVDFLVHFHGDRDFFECHELLEQYWKEHPESEYRNTWVGLIQSAVGMYHYRRGNISGAMKSLANSLKNSDPSALQALGINGLQWLERLEELRSKLEAEPSIPYTDLDIPIAELPLISLCESRCRQLGMEWRSPSDLAREGLIHRHKLRDRSDVIAARRAALVRRSGGR